MIRRFAYAFFWLERSERDSHVYRVVAPKEVKVVDGGGRFDTTRWSVILSSLDEGSESEKARVALSHLCRTYWRPVFAYISRCGHSVPDAQDLTQDFFVTILDGSLLERADPARGRFRSLLVKTLQHFLKDMHAKVSAQKRGGEVEFVSWDDWMAEAPSRLTVPAGALENWTPEQLFDVRWAATVAERALRSLQEECASLGRQRVFDALQSSLSADREDISYAALAQELGVGAGRDPECAPPVAPALSAASPQGSLEHCGNPGRSGRRAALPRFGAGRGTGEILIPTTAAAT